MQDASSFATRPQDFPDDVAALRALLAAQHAELVRRDEQLDQQQAQHESQHAELQALLVTTDGPGTQDAAETPPAEHDQRRVPGASAPRRGNDRTTRTGPRVCGARRRDRHETTERDGAGLGLPVAHRPAQLFRLHRESASGRKRRPNHSSPPGLTPEFPPAQPCPGLTFSTPRVFRPPASAEPKEVAVMNGDLCSLKWNTPSTYLPFTTAFTGDANCIFQFSMAVFSKFNRLAT